MKGIILAAGRGSRMGSLTDTKPKGLTEIAGKTLLDWQMSAMRHAGHHDLVVVRGYRSEELSGNRYEVVDNLRWNETNMVMSLAAASDHLENFVCTVSYADIAYHPDAIRALQSSNEDLAIAYDEDWVSLWSERFRDPLEDAETFRHRDGQLLEIGKKANSLNEIEGQYMGLLRFSPQGWAHISALLSAISANDRDQLDMTSLLALLLERGVRIGTVPVSGRWCEVDSERDLELYQSRIKQTVGGHRPWHHDWRWD